jgi:DNA-binding transcriptional LysR family regulator
VVPEYPPNGCAIASRERPPAQTRSRPLRCPHLEELRAFCAAADLGSLGRAAQRLYLTQPAVSRRVKSLEELVGAALFTRSAHGVRLTATGERVYAHASRLLNDAEQFTSTLAQLKGGGMGTVRLAISHTAAESVMPRALVRMRRATSAPVEVVVANSQVAREIVVHQRADVAIVACGVSESVPGLVNIPLLDDEIVLAVPLSHPWARRGAISPAELLASPVVLRDPGAHSRQVVDETLTAHGLDVLTAAWEVGSTQAAKQEAHELGLPTMISALTLGPADRLERVQISGLRFPRRFCVLHAPGPLRAEVRHMIDAFLAVVPAEPADDGFSGQ